MELTGELLKTIERMESQKIKITGISQVLKFQSEEQPDV